MLLLAFAAAHPVTPAQINAWIDEEKQTFSSRIARHTAPVTHHPVRPAIVARIKTQSSRETGKNG